MHLYFAMLTPRIVLQASPGALKGVMDGEERILVGSACLERLGAFLNGTSLACAMQARLMRNGQFATWQCQVDAHMDNIAVFMASVGNLHDDTTAHDAIVVCVEIIRLL